MSASLSQFEIHDESGLLRARQWTRTIAERLGFKPKELAEMTLAVTSVTRDAIKHTGGAQVEFRLEGDPPRSLAIRVVNGVPPLADPDQGHVRERDQPRPLRDTFEMDPSTGLTSVLIVRPLPCRDFSDISLNIDRIADDLPSIVESSPIDELLRQDRELLQTRSELEETHLAVLALLGELEARDASLKRASELKTQFLANVSHQLRTPLSSILSLARLLLDRADGELSVEQERQASFILRAAHDLTDLINDLIELATIASGSEVIHRSEVHLPEFFAKLRGMTRPLQQTDSPVALIFEAPVEFPTIWTDEGKLMEVLWNFLSNALKFTETGEIRVKAEPIPGDSVVFSVKDTGLGIAPEHLEHIFEEFGQIDSSLQRLTTGTGLGLPLARKIARVLGGQVEVLSQPGQGSIFTLTIPIHGTSETGTIEDR